MQLIYKSVLLKYILYVGCYKLVVCCVDISVYFLMCISGDITASSVALYLQSIKLCYKLPLSQSLRNKTHSILHNSVTFAL